MRLASCCRRSRLVLRRRRSQGKVKNQEVAITGLLDDVCDQANMKRFKFIPPKMVKGCQSFMDEYDGEFEKPLFDVDLATIEALTRETRDNRPGLNALQDAVCAQTVHVCKGVTVNPPRIEKPKRQPGAAAAVWANGVMPRRPRMTAGCRLLPNAK